eukprot:753888-Hanusia_phi.AAC.2
MGKTQLHGSEPNAPTLVTLHGTLSSAIGSFSLGTGGSLGSMPAIALPILMVSSDNSSSSSSIDSQLSAYATSSISDDA